MTYLGLAKKGFKFEGNQIKGSGGSRLLAGNYEQIERFESFLADFHQTESALVFNSGYNANLGLLSCVPQRGDIILYDELCHASIRDGIQLSNATSYSFKHNTLSDLEKKYRNTKKASETTYIVVESIYSMDGDMAPLAPIAELCQASGAALIVDEAHSTGFLGPRGEGLVVAEGLQTEVFARVHTFGKAIGSHGAIIERGG